MTPRELFTFAARLRTLLNSSEIYEHVKKIGKRLGLQTCLDSMIGGKLSFFHSISGSERKRVSIGYELIPEPPLLLLDEPTSGLDSMTSLRIYRNSIIIYRSNVRLYRKL